MRPLRLLNTETWVQEYAGRHRPGPDGEPTRFGSDMREVRDLILDFGPGQYDYRGPQQRITRRPLKGGGELVQHWVNDHRLYE